MANRKRRPRRIDPEVVQRIRELSALGHHPAGIERHLSADEEFADRTPHVRTIQKVVRDITPAEPRDWWSVTEATAEEARLVLPVLAEQIRRRANLEAAYEARHGRRISDLPAGALRIHRELAAWIAKLRTIAPELPLSEAYSLAIRYWFADTNPYLDAYLALHAWLPGAMARAVRDHLLPATGLGRAEG